MIRIYKTYNIVFFLRQYFFIFFITGSLSAEAQDADSNSLKTIAGNLLKEGIGLYEANLAAQVSSAFLVDKLSTENIFGSITYKKNDLLYSIFLSGSIKQPVVRYTFSFQLPFSPSTMKIDGQPRDLSEYEKSLYKMKKQILKMARKRKSFFTNYGDVALNPVFFQEENHTGVYLISSTHDPSFVPFGNDYLLFFNENSKLISKEKIHQNLIEISAVSPDTLSDDQALASFHTHSELSSPYITPTDICTILLHMERVSWESHIVISPGFVSFFFPGQKVLEIITREEYEKMVPDEKN